LDFLARLARLVPVLSVRTILSREGVTISDVSCRHAAGPGAAEHYGGAHALVLVRRGCFVRTARGRADLLDPTLAYAVAPGEEQSYDHPHGGGDDCTVLALDDDKLGLFAADSRGLAPGPLPTSPAADLEHRLLVAAARRGDDEHELVERALTLAATATATPAAAEPFPGARGAARRALVGAAREALAADPDRSLTALARELAVSSHHLSRTFRSQAGHTLARHRMRLRARRALERLAGGETDLARLAVDVGCADQSHLCRVIRAETGRTPAALRSALAAGMR
jgi:AraC-like DNA-binding protein